MKWGLSKDTVMKRAKVKSKKRKIAKYFGLSIIIIFICVGSYIGLQYKNFQATLNKMNEEVTEKTASGKVEKQIDMEPFSVLLLGVDERENDTGRSDTMIVLTVNPNQKTVKMLSIPRDTRTEIVGNNSTEKINHAYARGGIDMAIDSVENLLDIPIDYYVSVNMEGFLSIVDTLGGIQINNDMELKIKDYHFPEGELTLSGDEALIF